MNQDLQVNNLTVTNSSTLKGETLFKDKFTVDTDALKLGEFNDSVFLQFQADEAINSATHNNRQNNVLITETENEDLQRKNLNRNQSSKQVNITSSSDNFMVNSQSKIYNYQDTTQAAQLMYKGITRRVTYKSDNSMLKTKINSSKTVNQNFGVDTAVDKVIYGADTNMVSSRLIDLGVSEYIVKDDSVFERKIVDNELKWVSVKDEFRAHLIKASLADKRKQTKL